LAAPLNLSHEKQDAEPAEQEDDEDDDEDEPNGHGGVPFVSATGRQAPRAGRCRDNISAGAPQAMDA
jgi:hypothetical protein